MIIYYKYNNSVDINDVKKMKTTKNVGFFNTVEEIIKSVEQPYLSNYNTRLYTYDERLGKRVYIVTADYGDFKDQYVCYYIEYEFDELVPDKIFRDPLTPIFAAEHVICTGCGREYHNKLMNGLYQKSPIIIGVCSGCFRDKVEEMKNERISRSKDN